MASDRRWEQERLGAKAAFPMDPTGRSWSVPLKVPAIIVVVFSAAWLVLKQAGLEEAILRGLRLVGP